MFLRFSKNLLLFFLFAFVLNVQASSALNNILDVRASKTEDNIRFVLETSEKPTYKSFILKDPNRLVIDLKSGNNLANIANFKFRDVIKSVRINKKNSKNLRAVLDLYGRGKIIRSFNLSPDKKNKNYRIVVDFKHFADAGDLVNNGDMISEIAERSDVLTDEDFIGSLLDSQGIISADDEVLAFQDDTVIPMPNSVRSRSVISNSDIFEPIVFKNDIKRKYVAVEQKKINSLSRTTRSYKTKQNNTNREYVTYDIRKRKPVIVIDAGHGGKDPGAIGRRRTREKVITLTFAKNLRDDLRRRKKYKVYFTRNGDYFISLAGRVKKAQKLKADLFISFHADYSSNRKARGLSVYTLSEIASDKRAEMLARKENKADILAGVNFKGEYQDTIKILIDLSRRDTMNSSTEFAEFSITELSKRVRLLQNTHRYAGFAILTAPEVPSVLIELGFLSNTSDERILKTSAYRNKVNHSLSIAIDKFFKKKGYF
jgi:N-acetylmuramoyl-L-alanine amidase